MTENDNVFDGVLSNNQSGVGLTNPFLDGDDEEEEVAPAPSYGSDGNEGPGVGSDLADPFSGPESPSTPRRAWEGDEEEEYNGSGLFPPVKNDSNSFGNGFKNGYSSGDSDSFAGEGNGVSSQLEDTRGVDRWDEESYNRLARHTPTSPESPPVSSPSSPASVSSAEEFFQSLASQAVGGNSYEDEGYNDDFSDFDSVLAQADPDSPALALDEEEDYEATDDDAIALAQFEEIISYAIDQGASDVYLVPDERVSLSVLGRVLRVDRFGELSAGMVSRMFDKAITREAETQFFDHLELDTSYVVKTGRFRGRRLRMSAGRSFGNTYMVLRVISEHIPTPEELGVSPQIVRWSELSSGLVLVCGPTGSGKSTTFASVVGRILKTSAKAVISIEKPIEYVFPKVAGPGIIVQREVGQDTREFKDALKSSLRQKPDVIMLGEVRDREEFDELVRASETGHLAMSTMHTTSPAVTLNRIRSLFPSAEEQARVMETVASNLRGIVNQALVRNSDGNGRFAVQAVLEVTPEVAKIISSGDFSKIEQYMWDRGETMEHKLVEAVRQGKCTIEEARTHAPSPHLFDQIFSGSESV